MRTYACGVDETAATDRLDGRAVTLLLLMVVALTFVDAAIGRTLLPTMATALLADVAVAFAVLIAGRNLLAATVFAAAASASVSAAVANDSVNHLLLRADLIDANFIVGTGTWPGLGELAGMTVLCAMAIRHRPTSEATLAALTYGGALLAIVGWRQHGLYGELFLLILGVVFAATVATGVYSRSLERQRVEHARTTRQSERDAIARELHDLVAHHVTGIVVQAQAARLVVGERPDVTEHALTSIERAGADALSSMRAMVGALRTDQEVAPIAPTATLDDIRLLADSGSAALPVAVSLDATADRLPSSVTASLHRITIEALTNVRRHGIGATGVDVAVACGPQDVTLSVINDGAVVTERQTGFGLIGIAERVAALGGRFEAGPRPTGGWAVTAVLPTGRLDDRSR